MKLIASLSYFFALLAFFVFLAYGYIVNLVAVALHFDEMALGELIARLVRAVVAPLGTLMGYFA